MRTMISIFAMSLVVGAATVPVRAATATTAPSDTTVAAAEAIGKPLGDLSLPRATLVEALVTLRQRSGVRLTVNWDALKAVGVTPASAVAVAGRGLTLAQALDLTLTRVQGAAGPLCWYVHGRDIHVTSRAARMRIRQAGSFQPVQPGPSASAPASRPAEPGVQFQFDATPMTEVAAFFREQTGLNVIVAWKALEAIGVTDQTPVTLRIDRPIPVAQALDLFVQSLAPTAPPTAQVFWDVEGNILTITSGEALNRELITQAFDVSDLLAITPDFAGPRLTIQRQTASEGGGSAASSESSFTSGSAEPTPTGTGDLADERARREQQLIDAVRGAIGEQYWQPAGRGSIVIIRGKLVVSQTRLGFKLLARSLGRR
ncbi:MAG: hypothetical protein GX591_19395 [Planctomycetes bacterium]|nr:hypothetical protein [Planctomycetota bacterium]